jgi:hypothetical protein
MKKIFVSILTVGLLISCGGESTKEVNTTTAPQDSSATTTPQVCKKGYDVENTTIGFGGFKTTEKKEVKGTFTKFTVEGTKVADTPEEVFANATISIPISTIETKDIGRNKRIKEAYFGKMENTFVIKASIVSFNKDSNEVVVNITLNKIAKDVALNYTVSGDSISFDGELNILDFNGSDAVSALNEVCEALHTGADGESKTWAEVNLYVTSVLKEACK